MLRKAMILVAVGGFLAACTTDPYTGEQQLS